MSVTRVRRRAILFRSWLPGWPHVPARSLIIGVLLLCGAAVPAAALWFPAAGPAAVAPADLPLHSSASAVAHATTQTPLSSPARPAAAVTPAVAPASSAIPAPATGTVVIRLHPGDTLWTLARRYDTTIAALQQTNALGGSTRIYADTDFRVPTAHPTTVSPTAAAPHPGTPYRTPAHHTTAHTTAATITLPSAGSVQQTAAAIFGGQYTCAANIINRESGWNLHASNPVSGAYGLAQALPGAKMAAAGPDWRTNPATQLAWMRDYVTARYGGACGAWTFWQAHRWY